MSQTPLTIIETVPVTGNWCAAYFRQDLVSTRVVAWARFHEHPMGLQMGGMVIHPDIPAQIVPADTVSGFVGYYDASNPEALPAIRRRAQQIVQKISGQNRTGNTVMRRRGDTGMHTPQ